MNQQMPLLDFSRLNSYWPNRETPCHTLTHTHKDEAAATPSQYPASELSITASSTVYTVTLTPTKSLCCVAKVKNPEGGRGTMSGRRELRRLPVMQKHWRDSTFCPGWQLQLIKQIIAHLSLMLLTPTLPAAFNHRFLMQARSVQHSDKWEAVQHRYTKPTCESHMRARCWQLLIKRNLQKKKLTTVAGNKNSKLTVQ